MTVWAIEKSTRGKILLTLHFRSFATNCVQVGWRLIDDEHVQCVIIAECGAQYRPYKRELSSPILITK